LIGSVTAPADELRFRRREARPLSVPDVHESGQQVSQGIYPWNGRDRARKLDDGFRLPPAKFRPGPLNLGAAQ
jgi:hypothetical protein